MGRMPSSVNKLTRKFNKPKCVCVDQHRALLDNPVFEDAETSQEAAEILQEFIKLKTNNNDE